MKTGFRTSSRQAGQLDFAARWDQRTVKCAELRSGLRIPVPNRGCVRPHNGMGPAGPEGGAGKSIGGRHKNPVIQGRGKFILISTAHADHDAPVVRIDRNFIFQRRSWGCDFPGTRSAPQLGPVKPLKVAFGRSMINRTLSSPGSIRWGRIVAWSTSTYSLGIARGCMPGSAGPAPWDPAPHRHGSDPAVGASVCLKAVGVERIP